MEQSQTAKAILSLQDALRLEWDGQIAADPAFAKVAKVARAICKDVDIYGDPDLIVFGLPNGQLLLGPKGTVPFQFPVRPAWTLYLAEALAAIRIIEEASQ